MTGIQGKTAIVTGGASGIGRATALAFASEGARLLVATARSMAAAEQTAADIRALGGEADDVARAVLWLCSVEASFITANVLSVDGGLDIA